MLGDNYDNCARLSAVWAILRVDHQDQLIRQKDYFACRSYRTSGRRTSAASLGGSSQNHRRDHPRATPSPARKACAKESRAPYEKTNHEDEKGHRPGDKGHRGNDSVPSPDHAAQRQGQRHRNM